jgi:hypothetical protein
MGNAYLIEVTQLLSVPRQQSECWDTNSHMRKCSVSLCSQWKHVKYMLFRLLCYLHYAILLAFCYVDAFMPHPHHAFIPNPVFPARESNPDMPVKCAVHRA